MATATSTAPSAGFPNVGIEHAWLGVLCVLGLDYFSTLAYQPSITYEVAGRLGPLATIVVVAATLFGALPVYCYLAGRSPEGAGSLGIIERYVRGWRGKTLVLLLLGFAATDFIMLKTLSLADAAVHLVQNPDEHIKTAIDSLVVSIREHADGVIGERFVQKVNSQLIATLLIGAISFVFWFVLRRGFNRNVVVLAIPVVGLYMVLTGIIIAAGLWRIFDAPDGETSLWTTYLHRVRSGDWDIERDGAELPWWAIAGVSLIFLPKLALGLSGFEMSMIMMPQVRGRSSAHRVANTRRVLIVAALVMGLYLLGSTLVTTVFVPSDALSNGVAANRALAYLAHGQPLAEGRPHFLPIAGRWFGGLYDLSTVLILTFAGTSVMTALATLLPRFLLKFGMDFRWSQRWGVLLMIFAAINIIITVRFQASVDQQHNAYATGVVVLIVAACVASYVDARKRHRDQGGFWLGALRLWLLVVAVGFAVVALAVLIHAGGGIAIAGFFIAAILGLSVFSRAWRADELRTIGYHFVSDESKLMWEELRLADFPVLIPHRPGREPRESKETHIRRDHNLAESVDLVFLEIELDDPSDFFQHLNVEVRHENARYVIRVTGCASVPHAIASIALEMSRDSAPPGLHFGWPELDMLTASWSYLAFGEGNIPWKVKELIAEAEKDPTKRPRVVVG